MVGAARVSVPSHLVCFYSIDDGGMRLSVPFLREGLRAGQPCLSAFVAGRAKVIRIVGEMAAEREMFDSALVRALKAHPDLFDLRIGPFRN